MNARTSNTVMHYRVSVYNYFWRRFREEGYEFQVLTNRLQSQNRIQLEFRLDEMPFRFSAYRRAILERQPAVPHLRRKDHRGDELVIVDVEIPTKLTKEQRELFEKLGDAGNHRQAKGKGIPGLVE